MATIQKRVKKAKVAPIQPQPVAPADASADASAVALAVAPAVAPDASGASEKKNRGSSSKKLGLILPIPRIRRLLDVNGINKQISEVSELLATPDVPLPAFSAEFLESLVQKSFQTETEKYNKLNEAKKALKAAPVLATTLEQKQAVLSSARFRFSGKAVTLFTAAVDYIVVSLIKEVSAKGVDVGVDAVVSAVSKAPYQAFFALGPVEEGHKGSFDYYIKEYVKTLTPRVKWSSASVDLVSSIVEQIVSQIIPLIRLCAVNQSVHTISENLVRFVFQFKLLNAKQDSSELLAHINSKAKA